MASAQASAKFPTTSEWLKVPGASLASRFKRGCESAVSSFSLKSSAMLKIPSKIAQNGSDTMTAARFPPYDQAMLNKISIDTSPIAIVDMTTRGTETKDARALIIKNFKRV